MVAEQPWIGDRCFGGAAAIPVRRPFARIARGSEAWVGDAACQVFPAHGSGVGPGLIAAHTLAAALADGRGPTGYAVAWQRRWGGLLASYDVFRRHSQTLSAEQLARLMTTGLLDSHGVRQGLLQRLPTVPLRSVLPKALALARAPRIAAGFGAVLARMSIVRALYARYPEDPARLPAWARRVAAVFGEPQRT